MTTPLANILHPPSLRKLVSNNQEPPLYLTDPVDISIYLGLYLNIFLIILYSFYFYI